MKLSIFLQNLLSKGEVIVESNIIKFEEKDDQEVINILEKYYQEDKLEMPYLAPEFLPSAGLWAIKYFYYSIQSALLREIDEKTISDLLKDFELEKSPEAIYSVDLVFRHLPQLFDFIRALAPDDFLVKCIKEIAIKWPFSSVGIDFEDDFNIDNILKNKSLTYSYIDRIISYKDIKRIKNQKIMNLVEEVLGNYSETLWNDFYWIKNGSK